jgi:hypothetical protein
MSSTPTPEASTPSLVHGWVKGPDERGTLDILWTCLVTMFLGSWSALFLNLPEEASGRSRFFFNKGRWMFVVLLFPEMITAIAAEQWRSARQSVDDFKALKEQWEKTIDDDSQTLTESEKSRLDSNLSAIQASPWTMRHAFFVNMGGIHLKYPDSSALPLTAYQLKYMVDRGHLTYPGISQKEIWDKNKVDGFARMLTILQIIWFFIQCIGRAAQHLAITTLELSTLAFVFLYNQHSLLLDAQAAGRRNTHLFTVHQPAPRYRLRVWEES